jgi:hypothetical protein
MEDAVAVVEAPERPALQREGWIATEVRRIVVRLSDGETVQVGTAPNRYGALVLARSMIEEYERTGEWPLVGDRLLSPEAIVSVDVVRVR